MKRILHLVSVKNITFKSSYNWFKIDIFRLVRPLTAIFSHIQGHLNYCCLIEFCNFTNITNSCITCLPPLIERNKCPPFCSAFVWNCVQFAKVGQRVFQIVLKRVMYLLKTATNTGQPIFYQISTSLLFKLCWWCQIVIALIIFVFFIFHQTSTQIWLISTKEFFQGTPQSIKTNQIKTKPSIAELGKSFPFRTRLCVWLRV